MIYSKSEVRRAVLAAAIGTILLFAASFGPEIVHLWGWA